MHIPAHILQQAMELYLREAYPAGVPEPVRERASPLQALPGQALVPEALLEHDVLNAAGSLAVRLGHPVYPHMKLVMDPVPASGPDAGGSPAHDFLLRVDAHDRHLHAAPGSPDEAWLATVRQRNRELGEKIEAAWGAAGLPTFKEYLRAQLAARKRRAGA